jgi:diadenosine tetraphosphatase ApaH/serine/threonine PP2A family protein phosphatase
VFGHTPTKKAKIESEWAMIDTGAAYGRLGLGNMTAFLWPSKTTIVEPFQG